MPIVEVLNFLKKRPGKIELDLEFHKKCREVYVSTLADEMEATEKYCTMLRLLRGNS